MTSARIKAADFLSVSSRSTPEQWAEVDRLERLLLDHAAEQNARILTKYRTLFAAMQAIKTTAADAQQAAIDG